MMTQFHALLTAQDISNYVRTADRLVAAFASANIEVYPYQIAAAQFALRDEHIKGVILADEGGLGKTMETLLVLSQLWFEGKTRCLLIVPTPLLSQWTAVLECNFAVPYTVVSRENPDFEQDGIVLTTYEIAADFADEISGIVWNVAAFEEAHRLNNPENKATALLKAAVGNAFKYGFVRIDGVHRRNCAARCRGLL
jgi:SNF2 family DNA or RNA helicase